MRKRVRALITTAALSTVSCGPSLATLQERAELPTPCATAGECRQLRDSASKLAERCQEDEGPRSGAGRCWRERRLVGRFGYQACQIEKTDAACLPVYTSELQEESISQYPSDWGREACAVACSANPASACCNLIRRVPIEPPSSSLAEARTTTSAATPGPTTTSAFGSGTTSADVWEQARKADVANDSSALDKLEGDLATLEKKPDPWGEADLRLYDQCLDTVKAIRDRGNSALAPRIDAAVERLLRNKSKAEKGLAALKQQMQKDAAEQAKRQAEAERQLRPKCVECCHLEVPEATSEHCEAACKKVDTFESPSLGRLVSTSYASLRQGKLLCR